MTFHKRSMIMVAMAAGMCIAGRAPGQVGPETAQIAPRPVTKLDVAGIRLRASPAEVKAAITKAGYRITFVGRAAPFAEDVAGEVARRRATLPVGPWDAGTNNIIATGPHQENLVVDFLQAPGGSEVSNVDLEFPKKAISADGLRRQVLEKYGTPDASRSNASELSWCSSETRANCGRTIATSGPLDDQQPLLTASIDIYGGGGRLRLQIGETAFSRLAAEKEATVERLAPKTNRAAF